MASSARLATDSGVSLTQSPCIRAMVSLALSFVAIFKAPEGAVLKSTFFSTAVCE